MQKKISSELAYEASIFTVTHDEIQAANGLRYPRDVVHHHGGVGVLALQDQNILLVKQYRYAIGQTTLEIPAGKLELGEDPYTCGLRELEEESGFTSPKLQTICAMYSTPGFCTEKIYIYWTDDLQKVEHPLPMDEDEDISTQWISITEAYQLIQNGTIQDAKTILAIQFAYIHLRT